MRTAPNLSDPARLGARAACDAIRTGRLAPAAPLEECVDRIAARDATVQGWAFLGLQLLGRLGGDADPLSAGVWLQARLNPVGAPGA